MGALTVALLYLLARILFRRRAIAVLVAAFALLDGMFFVQSRIAMNDVYTGAFILAAYCVFAWLWIKPGRPRWAFWTLMPVDRRAAGPRAGVEVGGRLRHRRARRSSSSPARRWAGWC